MEISESTTFRPPLFGVIIGINEYASNAIPSLRGAVADAGAVAAYLQDQLKVPDDRLTVLENESATRAAILSALQGLADDIRIKHGDSILIYFAGHGSELPAPARWAWDAMVQLTLPYDVFCKSEDEVVAPIPDRTLGALLEAIAHKKGDNIVVIMDSCHSASGTRSLKSSSDNVRSMVVPSDFLLPANLDQDIWSLSPTHGSLQSHVLLSACSSSDQAFEANVGGRGNFTVALINFWKENHNQMSKLRYCDIVMRMNIDSGQIPYCEGFYRERYVFTTTSPQKIEYFIPVYTRTSKKGPWAYFLIGGAAHGLVVGDEFAIYHDMDYPVPIGTLIVDDVGPLLSICRSPSGDLPISGNSIALRTKEGKRKPLRIHVHPNNKVFEIISSLAQDFGPNLNLLNAPEDCSIDISMQDDQAMVRLRNPISTQCFRVAPTAEELLRVLKASWQYFSELDRTTDSPDITDNVQVELYVLQQSPSRVAGTPTAELVPVEVVPCDNDSFTLRQGAPYCLKLTNNSPYHLYPIVQCFDSTNEFKISTLYRPACTPSRLEPPLKKDGGSLSIGFGSSGSPPLVFTSRDGEGLMSLKITLSTWPLDPFYEARSFRMARYLSKDPKGSWATITKVVHFVEFVSTFNADLFDW